MRATYASRQPCDKVCDQAQVLMVLLYRKGVVKEQNQVGWLVYASFNAISSSNYIQSLTHLLLKSICFNNSLFKTKDLLILKLYNIRIG